jgi:FkbM family methyltransferase
MLINFIRKLLFFPLFVLNKFLVIYSKIISLFDPNGLECQLEELYQKQVDIKINKKLNNQNLNYKPKLISKKKEIIFFTPNKITNYRANTLFSKEEDTIKWIDQYGGKDNIFFDIGANIGVYSLYCAKLYKNRVFAFEPQYKNNVLLEKNIQINRLENFISVIPNPIYSKNKLDFLFSDENNLSGSASTTFIEKKNLKNSKPKKRLVLSFTIDFLVEKFLIPKPNLIKIDVDGNEHEVIKGAIKTINSLNCKSILIETFYKTEKQTKSILEKNFYLHSDSGINKIYFKK